MVRALALRAGTWWPDGLCPYCGTHDLSTERIYLDLGSTAGRDSCGLGPWGHDDCMYSTGGWPFGADFRFFLSLIGN